MFGLNLNKIGLMGGVFGVKLDCLDEVWVRYYYVYIKCYKMIINWMFC